MRTSFYASFRALVRSALLSSVALLPLASAERAFAAPLAPTAVASGAKDRKQVGITVYNQNFGLVREVRELSQLPSGQVSLEFQDVAATIQPETVHIRSLAGADSLRVLEQNYRYDLLTPQTLLEKYVNKTLRVYRYHQATGKEDAVDAKLLSVANGPVLSINGEITFDYGGRFGFKELPENLIAKPTLMWLLDSKRPKQSVEVSYLAQSMNWHADYVLVVDEKEQRADLTGWVTLVNQSGTNYENAELKLVAGDVNRVRDETPPAVPMVAYKSGAPGGAPFREEGLFEYHLYTLARPTTVLNNEQKQVTLLEAKGVSVEKRLLFFGQQYWFQSGVGEVAMNQKVGVYLDLQNSEKNQLGMPLPKGAIRVYKADKGGAQQFVGEDRIDHTPRDERVRIKLGEAFDVVGDRKQVKFTTLGNCSSESSWELELRNHKDTAVEVVDHEPVNGDWTIVSSSQPAERKDAQTFTFTVKVPARGKTKVSYVVRVRWC
jgi:hypothetical protein